MKGILYIFTIFFTLCHCAWGATRASELTNTTGYNYNYMYPYLSNNMRTDLNPGVTTSQSTSPIDVVVKTTPMAPARRVVPRTSKTARVAAPTQPSAPVARTTPADTRRVVARAGTRTTPVRISARGTRSDNTYAQHAANAPIPTTPAPAVSSAHCLADYTKCMNDYCERPDTAYNRCYCSSKLAQIDSKYQTEIDALIKQIITIQGANRWTDDEMNEYWQNTIGKYSDTNSWENLDNALDINWADTESRVRGQTAFNMGHEYCVQHLRACYYMAGNLRDAYRSEISRDCATYEQSLQRIKNTAESIVGSYNEK